MYWGGEMQSVNKAIGVLNFKESFFPPVMIHTLGHFNICYKKEKLLSIDNFTSTQQELIALLLSSLDKKVNAEQLQTYLWPESTPKKGRTNLDTCISRIRSLIADKIHPQKPNRYLYIKKGMVQLSNCTTDIDVFVKNVSKGLRYCESGNTTMALDFLRSGLIMWQGDFLTGAFRSERIIRFFEYTLLPLYRSCTETLCNMITELDEPTDIDNDILEIAIGFNSENPDFIKKIYQIHINSGNTIKASKTIKAYRKALKKEGLDQERINTLMEEIWVVS